MTPEREAMIKELWDRWGNLSSLRLGARTWFIQPEPDFRSPAPLDCEITLPPPLAYHLRRINYGEAVIECEGVEVHRMQI